MFPPGASSNHDREAWMAARWIPRTSFRTRSTLPKETGENRIKAARATGQSRVDTQASKNEGGLATKRRRPRAGSTQATPRRRLPRSLPIKKAAQAGSREAQARIETARKAIATKRMTAGELSADDKGAGSTAYPVGSAGQPAPCPAAGPQRQAPQAAPQQPPVPGAKLYKASGIPVDRTEKPFRTSSKVS